MMLRNTAAVVLMLTVLQANAFAQQDVHNHKGHDHKEHDHAQHQHQADAKHAGSGTKEAAIPKSGPHGGTLKQLGAIQIETLVRPTGLQLYAYDSQGKPLDLRDAKGLAMIQVAGESKKYRYDLSAELGKDQSVALLVAAVDLSRAGGHQVDLTFQLVGLPGAGRKPAKFTAQIVVPLTKAQQVAAAIQAQGICPISGQPLGGMGKPIAVTVNNQTIYVCCAGCVDTLKAEPAKYLAKLKNRAKQVKLVVTTATQADTAAIRRQKLCPVMDEPLGSMGAPLKVTGLGRDVFLCCKGCLKSLQKEPKKYLAKLPPLQVQGKRKQP